MTNNARALQRKLRSATADSREQAKAMVDMISWMITDGQLYSAELGYVPPADLVRNTGPEGLSKVAYNGGPLYGGPAGVRISGTASDAMDERID